MNRGAEEHQNPVLQFTGIPELMSRIGNDEALGKAISPTLHLQGSRGRFKKA